MEQNSIYNLMPVKDDEDYEYTRYLRQEKFDWIDIVFDVFKHIYDKVYANDNWERIDRKDYEYIKKITPSMMRRKIESYLIPPPAFDVIKKDTWEFEDQETRTARVMIERGVWKTVVVPEVNHRGIPIEEGNKFRNPHKPKDGPKTKIEQLLKMIKVRNKFQLRLWDEYTEKTYKKKSRTSEVLPWIALWAERTDALGDYGIYNNLRNINEYKWIFEELCRTYSWKRDKEIVKWLNVKILSNPELMWVPSLDRFEEGGDLVGLPQDSIYTLNTSGGIDGLKWVFPDGSPIEETDTTTGETKGMEMTKMPSRQVGKVDEINIEIKNYAEELLDLRKKKIKERNAYRAARESDNEKKFNYHKEKYDEYKKKIENIKSALRERELWDKVEVKEKELYKIRQQVNGGRRKVRKPRRVGTNRVGTRRFRKSKKKRTKRKRRKSLFRKKRTKRVVPRRKTRRFRKK